MNFSEIGGHSVVVVGLVQVSVHCWRFVMSQKVFAWMKRSFFFF